MSITNYNGLLVTIRQTSAPAVYDFTVENKGDATLWKIQLPTYELLGPGDFGLDDTHMPEYLTSEAPIKIPCLNPGDSMIFSRKKWGPLERYQGKASGSLYATFCPQEIDEGRLGLRASFFVLGALQNPPSTTKQSLVRQPRAYRLGQAFRNLIDRLRRR